MTSQRRFLRIALLALFALLISPPSLSAQTAIAANVSPARASAAPPHFDLAAIHPSPFANHPDTVIEYLPSGRFVVRQATMVNLIAFAWSVDSDRVLRGPAWLDFDRFDISARAPKGATADDFRLMLRGLLADRFALTVRTETKSMPAYVLTAGKGGLKMKPAAKAADGTTVAPSYDWQQQAPSPGAPPLNVITCKDTTMVDFARDLHDWAYGGGNYLSSAVVNQTGLTGAYDFEFKWTPRGQLARAGDEGISLFDAVDKLGLKLEAKPAPLPVVYVDAANEKPTPNAPGLDKTLAPPLAEFEVATFRPSAPDTKGINGQVTGDKVDLRGATMQWFITWIWDISDDMIADPPKWLNQDRWDILAKIAHDPASDGHNGLQNTDESQLTEMFKKLLADRFGLQAHLEDRPADAYTLVAAGPHMKKADPDNRTGCHNGPGPDGKDPRIANPVLNRLLTCQNMTMAQFGDILRINASGYVHSPVLDQTGLTNAYDFTLSFSGAGQLQNGPKQADSSSGEASAPNGAISLFDAVQKQMGVKLIQQKRPVQMLVIDHINQQPTDN